MMYPIWRRHSHRTPIVLAALVLAAVPYTGMGCDGTEVRLGSPLDDDSASDRDQRSEATVESEPLSAGAALFEQRCAKCHDVVPGIPTREMMAKFSKDYVIDALTKGLMIDQAIGLSDSEIEALARYVSGEKCQAEPRND